MADANIHPPWTSFGAKKHYMWTEIMFLGMHVLFFNKKLAFNLIFYFKSCPLIFCMLHIVLTKSECKLIFYRNKRERDLGKAKI